MKSSPRNIIKVWIKQLSSPRERDNAWGIQVIIGFLWILVKLQIAWNLVMDEEDHHLCYLCKSIVVGLGELAKGNLSSGNEWVH